MARGLGEGAADREDCIFIQSRSVGKSCLQGSGRPAGSSLFSDKVVIIYAARVSFRVRTNTNCLVRGLGACGKVTLEHGAFLR